MVEAELTPQPSCEKPIIPGKKRLHEHQPLQIERRIFRFALGSGIAQGLGSESLLSARFEILSSDDDRSVVPELAPRQAFRIWWLAISRRHLPRQSSFSITLL